MRVCLPGRQAGPGAGVQLHGVPVLLGVGHRPGVVRPQLLLHLALRLLVLRSRGVFRGTPGRESEHWWVGGGMANKASLSHP